MAEGLVIRGYGCTFGTEAIVAGVREHVVPGAFWGLTLDTGIQWGVHNGYVLARTRKEQSIVFLTGFFAGLWLTSAWLFWKAAQERPPVAR